MTSFISELLFVVKETLLNPSKDSFFPSQKSNRVMLEDLELAGSSINIQFGNNESVQDDIKELQDAIKSQTIQIREIKEKINEIGNKVNQSKIDVGFKRLVWAILLTTILAAILALFLSMQPQLNATQKNLLKGCQFFYENGGLAIMALIGGKIVLK